MHVWRWSLAWVDEGIDTVNDCLSATKPQHGEALITELPRLQVMSWLSLWRQSMRKACEKKRRKKHIGVSLRLHLREEGIPEKNK